MNFAFPSIHHLRSILCAVAGIALLASGASAALPYADGDIFLGFRATGGEGATTDYLVNIGSATQFTGASGQSTINVGNIATDLVNTYGADWKTRSDVVWSVSGVQSVAGNGFPNRTMFATALEPTPGTQSVPWTRPSSFGAGVPVNKMAAMAGSSGYAAGATADQSISPNNAKALLQSTNAQNSYASFQPGGVNTNGQSAFSYFLTGTAIEGSFANGTAGSILDFYKIETGSGAAVLVGAFKLDNNGNLTFSTDISVFAPPATVAIEQATYSVNEDAAGGQVAIKLVRTGNAGTAFSVNFSTSNDSAVAGTDFTGQTNVPVSFAANDTSKTVNVAIARRTGFQGNRQFGIAISGPTGNVSLGAISTAIVSIVEVDPAPPTVAFSAASYPVNEDAGQVAVALTRTGDATAAFTVNFSTADGTALAGTDFTGQTNAPVSFAAGETTKTVNVAIAHRAGFQGNRAFNVTLSSPSGAILGGQSSATVPIAEVDPQPATLVFGSAAFSVAENVAGGTVAIAISRSGVTTGAGSVTFSTSNGTALAGTDYTAQTNVQVDFAANETTKTVNIAVLDRSGFQPSRQFTVTLSNATNGGTLGAPSSATVTVTDKDAQVSGAVAGTYRGLIVPTGTPANETSGSIALTVTTTGSFTGQLHLGGGSLSFGGRFDQSGAAQFKPGLTPTLKLKINCDTPLDLGTLALKIAGDVIDGAASNPGVVANVHFERDAFDGRTVQTSVDPSFLANGGKYTVVLPSKAQTGLAASAFPQGDGIGFITLNRKGRVTFTGTLADGRAFTSITKLAKNYTCPVFVVMYKMSGSLAGNLAFQISADSDLSGSDFLWLRPIAARSAYYPAGWPFGVKLDVLGASYAIPPKNPPTSAFPGLGAVDLVNGNASLEVADGKLTAPIAKNLNIYPNNAVRAVPATDTSFNAVISKNTGRVSGKFTHTDGRKPKFNAVIYQKGATRGAFGYFLSIVPAGATTGESGGVSFTPK